MSWQTAITSNDQTNLTRLTDAEKSLLVKGLNFTLPPKQLCYSDYLINFELFYRNIENLKILSGDNLDFLKTRIKDIL